MKRALLNITILFFVLIIFCFPGVSLAKTLGPYSGKVIDSLTGTPVAGASVLFFWKMYESRWEGERGTLIEAKLVYTDHNGFFHIPTFVAASGRPTRLDSSNAVIYQPGYQSHIGRIHYIWRWDGNEHPFREDGNIIKLERLPPGFDHKKHYERVEEALRGYGTEIPLDEKAPWSIWESIFEKHLKWLPEREELLRRIEWEKCQ